MLLTPSANSQSTWKAQPFDKLQCPSIQNVGTQQSRQSSENVLRRLRGNPRLSEQKSKLIPLSSAAGEVTSTENIPSGDNHKPWFSRKPLNRGCLIWMGVWDYTRSSPAGNQKSHTTYKCIGLVRQSVRAELSASEGMCTDNSLGNRVPVHECGDSVSVLQHHLIAASIPSPPSPHTAVEMEAAAWLPSSIYGSDKVPEIQTAVHQQFHCQEKELEISRRPASLHCTDTVWREKNT